MVFLIQGNDPFPQDNQTTKNSSSKWKRWPTRSKIGGLAHIYATNPSVRHENSITMRVALTSPGFSPLTTSLPQDLQTTRNSLSEWKIRPERTQFGGLTQIHLAYPSLPHKVSITICFPLTSPRFKLLATLVRKHPILKTKRMLRPGELWFPPRTYSQWRISKIPIILQLGYGPQSVVLYWY